MNPIIKCEHTDFGYENHDAVIDLNLEIYPGDYLCVVGENGSGKSTLIKGMLGLLKPTGGSLSVADELKRGGRLQPRRIFRLRYRGLCCPEP